MSASRPIPAIAEKWAAAWNSKSAQAMADLFTEDGVYEDLAFQFTSAGLKAVAGWISVGANHLPDLKIEITDAFEADDRIAVRWTFSATPLLLGTIPSTGKRFSVPAASVFELRGGRIAKVQDFYNLADVLRQLGLPSGPFVPGHLQVAA